MNSGLDGNAGRPGEDVIGLSVWVPNGLTQGVLGDIMAWKQPDPAAIERNKCLQKPKIAIESSERPTAVVGWRPSGKSRLEGSGRAWDAGKFLVETPKHDILMRIAGGGRHREVIWEMSGNMLPSSDLRSGKRRGRSPDEHSGFYREGRARYRSLVLSCLMVPARRDVCFRAGGV